VRERPCKRIYFNIPTGMFSDFIKVCEYNGYLVDDIGTVRAFGGFGVARSCVVVVPDEDIAEGAGWPGYMLNSKELRWTSPKEES
jgi:hypothetical protein